MISTLLDALAAREAWDEGRTWLKWWRDFATRVDHPESYSTLRNFDAEWRWEVRARRIEIAKDIFDRSMIFAERSWAANTLRCKGSAPLGLSFP